MDGLGAEADNVNPVGVKARFYPCKLSLLFFLFLYILLVVVDRANVPLVDKAFKLIFFKDLACLYPCACPCFGGVPGK